jgi:Type II secretion system (T2SS), protein N
VSLLVRSTPDRFSFTRADGTIWQARFSDTRIGALQAGDVSWRIEPGALVKGALGARMTFDGADLKGDLTVWRDASGVQRLAAQSLTIKGAAPISPLLQGSTAITGLDVTFKDGACLEATGALRSDVAAQSARVLGGQGPLLSGAATCGNRELWLPLEGASGSERYRIILALRANGEARWQADVVPGTVERAGALAVVGFRAVPEEPYLRQTKAFRWLPN